MSVFTANVLMKCSQYIEAVPKEFRRNCSDGESSDSGLTSSSTESEREEKAVGKDSGGEEKGSKEEEVPANYNMNMFATAIKRQLTITSSCVLLDTVDEALNKRLENEGLGFFRNAGLESGDVEAIESYMERAEEVQGSRSLINKFHSNTKQMETWVEKTDQRNNVSKRRKNGVRKSEFDFRPASKVGKRFVAHVGRYRKRCEWWIPAARPLQKIALLDEAHQEDEDASPRSTGVSADDYRQLSELLVDSHFEDLSLLAALREDEAALLHQGKSDPATSQARASSNEVMENSQSPKTELLRESGRPMNVSSRRFEADRQLPRTEVVAMEKHRVRAIIDRTSQVRAARPASAVAAARSLKRGDTGDVPNKLPCYMAQPAPAASRLHNVLGWSPHVQKPSTDQQRHKGNVVHKQNDAQRVFKLESPKQARRPQHSPRGNDESAESSQPGEKRQTVVAAERRKMTNKRTTSPTLSLQPVARKQAASPIDLASVKSRYKVETALEDRLRSQYAPLQEAAHALDKQLRSAAPPPMLRTWDERWRRRQEAIELACTRRRETALAEAEAYRIKMREEETMRASAAFLLQVHDLTDNADAKLLHLVRKGDVSTLVESEAVSHASVLAKREALFTAARNGHAEVLQLLLAGGCDPSWVEARSGRTSLDLAVAGDHDQCVDLLQPSSGAAAPRGPSSKAPAEIETAAPGAEGE